jgi:basic membrane protein A
MKMKNALILLFAALVMISCGQKKEEPKTEAAPEAAAAAEPAKPSCVLLTDATGIDDKSFNAAAWRGIVDFYGDTVENATGRGKLYDVVTAETQDMYIPNLRQAADEGHDLIIVTGFTWADAITEVAPQYPDQKFSIIDVNWIGQPNVMEFVFSEEQGSYLVGVAAALQSQEDGIDNPRFGFIGGVPGATITKFEVGYIQGVKSVLPDAEFIDYYANDWGKPELAKAQAKNWYDNGVYCIFSAAGGTGNGTIAQAKEYRLKGMDVWAIGVDSDQYEDGIYEGTKSAVLTSMLKRVESAAAGVLGAVEDGSFSGKVVQLGMVEEGVGFSTTNPELSASVVEKVKAIQQDIIAGKITVYPTYAESLKMGVVPEGLAALDD